MSYLINEQNIKQYKHVPNQKGFAVSVELDSDGFFDILKKLDVSAKNIVERTDVKHAVAYMIIDAANKEQLVPFKDNYKTTNDINKKYFMGNKIFQKTKQTKAGTVNLGSEIRRGRIYMQPTANTSPYDADMRTRKRYREYNKNLTSPRYYHKVEERNEEFRMVNGKTQLKGKALKLYESLTPKSVMGLNKRRSITTANGRTLYKAQINPTLKWQYQTYDDYYRKNKKGDSVLRFKNMNPNYIKQGRGEGYGTGMKHGVTYADRPPHLKDSYRVVSNASKGTSRIIYSVRKKPDKYYVDYQNGSDNYAYTQYYAEDENWHRTTPETTSRWLEVAIGIPVDAKIQVPSIPTGEANFKQIEKFVKTKLMRGVK